MRGTILVPALVTVLSTVSALPSIRPESQVDSVIIPDGNPPFCTLGDSSENCIPHPDTPKEKVYGENGRYCSSHLDLPTEVGSDGIARYSGCRNITEGVYARDVPAPQWQPGGGHGGYQKDDS